MIVSLSLITNIPLPTIEGVPAAGASGKIQTALMGSIAPVLTFKRKLGANPAPITYLNSVPASRDEARESEIPAIHREMAHTRVNIRRTSSEIRQELASNALRVISGECHGEDPYA